MQEEEEKSDMNKWIITGLLAALLFSPAAAVDVENYTVTLELDAAEIYVDGETAEEKVYTPGELDYPYIVSGDARGLVSYGELVELEYRQETRDVFSVTQSSGSFLIPFTTNYTGVERRKDLVQERTFLEQYNPSFGFAISEQPVVRAIYDFNYSVTGFDDTTSGIVELGIRNSLTHTNTTLIEVRALS